jgi:hypothetical protein
MGVSLLSPAVSVASIALPLADANFFHQFLRLSKVLEKKSHH